MHKLPEPKMGACENLQKNHCTKLGVKCVEKRWFCWWDECLIAERKLTGGEIPPAKS